MLGPTLHFKGELYGEEDLEFQGQLEGSIEHTRSLSIGKEGGVTGNIRAKFVIVEGRVDGDIFATESVSIRASAKVKGNIYRAARRHRGWCEFQRQHRHEPQGRGGGNPSGHRPGDAQRSCGGASADEGCGLTAPAGAFGSTGATSSTMFADKARRDSCAPSAALLDSKTIAIPASG